ncbi:MAG: YdaS family helix-turn-helix protein [Pseudomonadota bacterium]
METKPDTPEQLALDRAIAEAGGKTALMRKLNERGWEIKSHNTITQWRDTSSIPEKYCPDIEDLTKVRCEDLSPKPNWAAIRETLRQAQQEA